MKKSIQLLSLIFVLFLTSCNKEENIIENKKSQILSPLARAMGFFKTIEETDPADATFMIMGQNSFVANPTVLAKGLLDFSADSNMKGVDIGDVMFNNILVKGADGYNKFYDETQLVQMDSDIASIFGNNVRVQNINCSGSLLCNFDFTIPMIHKFKNLNVVGLQDQYYIQKSNGFTLTWDAATIAADEIIGVVIVEANQNAKAGDPVKSFAKLASTNNQVEITASDLSAFSEKDIITIMLIKGKPFTNILSNGKKVRIIAGDVMHFAYTLR